MAAGVSGQRDARLPTTVNHDQETNQDEHTTLAGALIFSADETAGVGIDSETTVTDDYTRASSEFTGKIRQVKISLK